jgi:polysaccharide export outer membrane protein
MKYKALRRLLIAISLSGLMGTPAGAQQAIPPSTGNGLGSASPSATLPAGYVIGAHDVLSIVFWRERDLTVDVVVRPDGKISLPLLNDVQAEGYTPEKLGAAIAQLASKYITDPNATVIVREIHSRNVYVLGQVSRPGSFPLTSDLNVLKVLALAGGLLEYADKDDVVILRTVNGGEQRLKFNYNEVIKGKNVEQNVRLQPGDTVVVR